MELALEEPNIAIQTARRLSETKVLGCKDRKGPETGPAQKMRTKKLSNGTLPCFPGLGLVFLPHVFWEG